MEDSKRAVDTVRVRRAGGRRYHLDRPRGRGGQRRGGRQRCRGREHGHRRQCCRGRERRNGRQRRRRWQLSDRWQRRRRRLCGDRRKRRRRRERRNGRQRRGCWQPPDGAGRWHPRVRCDPGMRALPALRCMRRLHRLRRLRGVHRLSWTARGRWSARTSEHDRDDPRSLLNLHAGDRASPGVTGRLFPDGCAECYPRRYRTCLSSRVGTAARRGRSISACARGGPRTCPLRRAAVVGRWTAQGCIRCRRLPSRGEPG